MRTFVKASAALALCFVLVACKSDEERAEDFFESALELMSEGDTERAIIELRNVFELNNGHRDARIMLAKIEYDRNNDGQAYRQFLRVAEQFPEDVEARIYLAELAFKVQNWEEIERHGSVAAELAPEDPRVILITLGRDYRAAAIADDFAAMSALAEQAEAKVQEAPESTILRRMLMDNALRVGDSAMALEQLDALIKLEPNEKRYYVARLRIIAEQDDGEAVEALLLEMTETFPDDQSFQSMLLRVYVAESKVDEAEEFMRSRTEGDQNSSTAEAELVRFLIEARGTEAALQEVERLLQTTAAPVPLRGLKASILHSNGESERALEELEAVIQEGITDQVELHATKFLLAQILLQTGDNVGARSLAEEILQEDTTYPEALKLLAAQQILEDDMDAAIANLRLALDREPDDVAAMTLMSQAYSRSGNDDLAREFLGMAYEASGNAPQQALAYAGRLRRDGRLLAAEDVLISSLRAGQSNIEVVSALGEIYIELEDFGRLTQVINTLRNAETPEATQLANAFEAERLNRQSGAADALSFLEEIANQEDDSISARLLLMRGQISTGDFEGALERAQELVDENPGDDELLFVFANVRAVRGDLEGAETILRDLVGEDAAQPRYTLQLARNLARQGRIDESDAVIEMALAANPEEPDYLWARASTLERDGEIDETIAIYEDLYADDSTSLIITNNLASMLATYRDDEESLERAYRISRRLANVDIPQTNDTYGWIAYRKGEFDEALPYLESAAEALSDDPIVQYHLGMLYAALGRNDEAITQLQRALAMAGPLETRQQFDIARSEIQRLQSLPTE